MAQASFGRKWLAGIIRNDELSPEEKENLIMESHIGVTDGLKDRIEELKAEADKAADLQKQLDDQANGEDFKSKYEAEKKAHEELKQKIASDAEAAKVRTAYRKLLADEGISEKRLDSILKVSDLSGVKLDDDGNLVDADKLRKSINEEWSEFKTTVTQKGATVEKPLQTGKPTKTREDVPDDSAASPSFDNPVA